MKMEPVKSSNISHVGYDPNAGVLGVKFKSGGEYHFHGITPEQHASLRGAPSLGSHLHHVIKPAAIKVVKV